MDSSVSFTSSSVDLSLLNGDNLSPEKLSSKSSSHHEIYGNVSYTNLEGTSQDSGPTKVFADSTSQSLNQSEGKPLESKQVKLLTDEVINAQITSVGNKFRETFFGRRLRYTDSSTRKKRTMGMSRSKLNKIMDDARPKLQKVAANEYVEVTRKSFWGTKHYFVCIEERKVQSESSIKTEMDMVILKKRSSFRKGAFNTVAKVKKMYPGSNTSKKEVVRTPKIAMSTEKIDELKEMETKVSERCNSDDMRSRYGDNHVPIGNFPTAVSCDQQKEKKVVTNLFLPRYELSLAEAASNPNYAPLHILGAIGRDMIKMLDLLQGCQIAHGDIKPENIMIKDGRAYLIDHDGATMGKEGKLPESPTAYTTEFYQEVDDPYKCDQIAMGRTFFEMFTDMSIQQIGHSREDNTLIDRGEAKECLKMSVLRNLNTETKNKVINTILDLMDGKVEDYQQAVEAMNDLAHVKASLAVI